VPAHASEGLMLVAEATTGAVNLPCRSKQAVNRRDIHPINV